MRVYQFRHIRAERQFSPGDEGWLNVVFTQSVNARPSRGVVAALAAANLVPFLLLIGGAYTAIFGVRVGAWLVVAGVAVRIGVDVTVGIWGYRDTFRRPWPDVAPLEDDDDDW